MKTAVMMTGEMEFTDIFYTPPANRTNENTVFYEIIAYLIFILFLGIMTILVMNLLVSLSPMRQNMNLINVLLLFVQSFYYILWLFMLNFDPCPDFYNYNWSPIPIIASFFENI